MTQRKRNIRVTPRRRSEPDIRRLGRALIELAQAEAERAAEAEHRQRLDGKAKTNKPSDPSEGAA